MGDAESTEPLESPSRYKDILPHQLGSLDWEPEHAGQSLDTVYDHVVGLATDAISWYTSHRGSKKRWAQRLRVGAIFMVAVAGILPVLSQITIQRASLRIDPAWATVALGVAVALVALDRFFGFSSAWARYMTTGQAIAAALNQFRIDWQQTKRRLSQEASTDEQIDQLLGLARGLVAQCDQLIQVETGQWVSEFRATLAEIESAVEAPRK